MLSPSSPAQKNLSEEDSSGSDAGSEVSLEPETDRFGFILTNGSAAGSLGPPPELVRQRETKWINIIQQWDRILSKKTNKVKVQCQKGIPASLRAKCWPLLCGATDRMKENENLYQSLDLQPALQSWVDVIERDLDRQFPFHEMFLSKDGHGQRGLFRVLKAYTQYQPEEGYCQAQGPVAAVLLMNMPAEEAFWCLVQISEQYLPGYYSPSLEGVLFDAAMLSWVLKRTCPAAHKHMQQHGVEPLMFATDWLMCLFTRHLPFNTLLRVWDLFFCYGVRVLLQVAVVLVRRVLGRAEQRKQCQGQMETLEKLRGVREEVQEEDDSFIAEVCSVPLSARDLEKHTVKELEKWRKDRPSSTFDPRRRCHGFHMAWTRARQNKEEQNRKEREKGNLSVPIARSASTLSLSPSLLHKRWRRGGKVNTGEWEGGGKVVRHLSMGAKEDWNSWTELNFEKVQDVQEEEDVISEECKKQKEPNLKGQTEEEKLLEEPIKTDKIQNTPAVHIEETVVMNDQTEKVETRVTEEEGSTLVSEHTEETCVEAELNKGTSIDQTAENILQPNEHTSQHQQVEELGSCSQSQVEEPQNDQGQDQEIEVKDINEETDKQVVEESEDTAAVQENLNVVQEDGAAETNKENLQVSTDILIQADMQPEEGAETKDVQVRQVGTEFSETRTETSPGSEMITEAIPVKYPHPTETQQQQEETITEIDTSSSGDVFEEKYHSPESLAETEIEETHTQTETGTDVLTQPEGKADENATTQDELETVIIQTDSDQHVDSNLETKTEAETLILSSPECSQKGECTDIVTDTESEAEMTLTHDIESSEAFAHSSEKECDRVACELTQEKEESILTVYSEEKVDSDHTQAEEIPTETPTKVEDLDSATPPQKEEAVNLVIESQQRSSVEMSSEEPAPEQPASQVTMEETENVKENTVEEVFISTPNVTDEPHSDDIPQVQDKDSSQAETNSSGLTQTSRRHSSRSSGDFCVRRSSTSQGSRLARKLSEDLFTGPQKASQSESGSTQSDIQHTESQSNPVNQILSEVTQSSQVKPPPSTLSMTEGTEAQQEPQAPPKRFGLFRRLKGEQPKKSKGKGTQKMQVPKILIQDFSDGTGKPVQEEDEEKLTSRERRRRRREKERREKEEERLRKKKEKELERERERERRKPQTRGKSFQVQKKKDSDDVSHLDNTGSESLRHSASYAESYF